MYALIKVSAEGQNQNALDICNENFQIRLRIKSVLNTEYCVNIELEETKLFGCKMLSATLSILTETQQSLLVLDIDSIDLDGAPFVQSVAFKSNHVEFLTEADLFNSLPHLQKN